MKKLITLVLAVCMLLAATTAFAADKFTPSVTAKSAPGVLKAWIEDANGNVVKILILDEEIVFTAVADLANVADADIYNKLNASYQAILAANTLADLGLVGAENLIVRDLFEVTLINTTVDAGNVLKIIFECDAPFALAVNGANGWALGLADAIVDNGDGTITTTTLEAGTVAFLVDALALGTVTSPAT